MVDLDYLDELLSPWRASLGADYDGYHNHVVRMASFCLLLRSCDAVEQRKIETAACFHDLGLFTDGTLDYLPPSMALAREHLQATGQSDWQEEIQEMILEHHKLRPVRQASSPLVELFRRGDLTDFSLGRIRFGLPRQVVAEVRAAYPNAGFHKMLLLRAGHWLLRRPWNPAPMMRW